MTHASKRVGLSIRVVRFSRFVRSRFVRMESRHDWRMTVALGIIFVTVGLIGFWTAPGVSRHAAWSDYVFPTVLLVMGSLNLFVCWRRRHWVFPE